MVAARVRPLENQMTVILFTAHAPHPLTDELACLGHQVHEALAVSEVFSLVEQPPPAVVRKNSMLHR